MFSTHTLLLKCRDDGADDKTLLGEVASGIGERPHLASLRVHRALSAREIYGYFDLGRPVPSSADAMLQLASRVRAHPALSNRMPAIDALELQFDAPGASAKQEARFHYVVEMDPAPGWSDEIIRWYDTEHMPGLAAVPGCVRARRFINHGGGPLSLACYDLIQAETIESPPWLAVRHTAWSDRVRPHFRNPKRTMFRTVAVEASSEAV